MERRRSSLDHLIWLVVAQDARHSSDVARAITYML